jgi:ABC-type dipeptide/oligopeptide/nickel transport system permease component
MVRFFLNRLTALIITIIIITALMYACLMLFPPDERASLYLSPRARRSPETLQRLIDNVIERYHMQDPYLVQYTHWWANLLKGEWGYSPIYDKDIYPVLVERIPVTLELTFYSLLLVIPLGILTGVASGRRPNSVFDFSFRSLAFAANSIPLFILAFIMLAVFYIGLYWFAPGRVDALTSIYIKSAQFKHFTGFLTLDGILNGRLDISLEALRHLMLPVLTLSFFHWATLARVTRTSVIEELGRDYIVAAKARGLPQWTITWRHIFLNALSPALTSSALTVASLVTGVFVVELIFNYNGVSDLITGSSSFVPDVAAVMAFALYSVIITLSIMFILDLLRALIDPRIREEVSEL